MGHKSSGNLVLFRINTGAWVSEAIYTSTVCTTGYKGFLTRSGNYFWAACRPGSAHPMFMLQKAGTMDTTKTYSTYTVDIKFSCSTDNADLYAYFMTI